MYPNRYKGNPICFKTAGRIFDEDWKCDGLVKGGGLCTGHKNRDPKDWLDGTKHMIESTKCDIAYCTKRLAHLEALNAKIKRKGAAAVLVIDPHPGRDRPMQALAVGDLQDAIVEAEEASYVASVVNALDSFSDSDDVNMWLACPKEKKLPMTYNCGETYTNDICGKNGCDDNNIDNNCDDDNVTVLQEKNTS